ncbi:8-methylmenaquinol:fumarate reductase membrane anchor subunit [Sporomusa silvacetica DSM 10669]|uniref:8-methylmenaquinol:fumarate reductase membrane anchor subunit n=1 Tax=Sporomusa silvacetica DSM 10669 TaxID=1123289 RepID=A0ABZ3ITC2_9FIRM|nr:CoB--CoM heterodisulfide reductase iron-sulfur subunit B family protein [Sporomusa silvacetica]OZC19432.1 lactate utilization protein A [Sporomusa silvacetica DSM 10669]
MKYAFFPGCVLRGAASEAFLATVKVTEALGIELVEIPNWTCCGASHLQDVDEITALAINARNLAIAETMGLPLMTVCNTCTLQLRRAKETLAQDAKLKAKVNAIFAKSGYEYRGTVEITHLLWVLASNPQLLAGKVVKPLTGVKVAGYYGCHLLRPPTIMNYEDCLHPQSLEKIIGLLGAEAVDFEFKLKCCGFHAFWTAEKDVLKVTGQTVDSAAKAGAEMVVTPCPLCQMQLDMYQPEGREAAKTQADLPILHLPQLIGLALGMRKDELGIQRHVSAAEKVRG